MKSIAWTEGNEVRLLENGEAFFPRVCEVIADAQHEVLLETFILADDEVGQQLRRALCTAARRGARVALVLDGYGTPELPAGYLTALADSGVAVRWFDPQPRRMGFRTNLFRRLHRKLVLVDGELAFIGGINFSVEHLRGGGVQSKQDYAVEVRGPVVEQVRALMDGAAGAPRPTSRLRRWWRSLRAAGAGGGSALARAALVVRDDDAHRQDIEHAYRLGIHAAKREIIIANAYFFPGYRLLRDLRGAARRGVAVHLILQGRPDLRWVRWSALTLYDYLLRGGVRIHEYCERALHGKVAVIDGTWATVGSSNLDPLSLFLNLEANLVVEDEAFAGVLRERLESLMQTQCKEMFIPKAGPSTPLRSLTGFVTFHLLRRLPGIAGWVPAHHHGQGPLREAAGKWEGDGSSEAMRLR